MDPFLSPFSTLVFAGITGNIELVNQLLEERNYNINDTTASGETPLFYVIQYGNIKVLNQLILKFDLSINIRDAYGTNPVQSKYIDVERIDYLLNQPDNKFFTMINFKGRNALHYYSVSYINLDIDPDTLQVYSYTDCR